MRVAALITTLAVASFLFPLQAFSQAGQTGGTRSGIPMHYERTLLSLLISDVARATDRRFIYDSDMTGRISITVPDRVSDEEALELLFAALYLNNLTAVPTEDGTIRIVPIMQALAMAPMGEPDSLSGSQPVTTLIRLDHVSAQRTAETLRPYVSKKGLALAYEPSNSLILAGAEGEVMRWITIARILDAASQEELMVRTIRYRSVNKVAEVLEVVFNESALENQRIKIVTDDRASRMIVEATPLVLEEVRRFIDDFDRPVDGEGLIQVVRVLNRDAQELAELLTGLSSSGSASSPSAQASPNASQSVAGRQKLVGRDFQIDVDEATQSLLIRADPETFSLLVDAIAQLDRHPPQVSVEAVVFEIRRPESFILGLNYFLPLTTPSSVTDFAVFTQSGRGQLDFESFPNIGSRPSGPADGAVAFGRYSREPILLTLQDPTVGTITIPIPREDVSIDAGEINVETNILLRPNIVGVSGEEHEIFAGDNIPIPSSQTASATGDGTVSNQGNPLNVTQNIERVDVGTRLRIKPTIREEGNVRLELELEISSLVKSLAGDVEEVGPTYADTNLETTFELRPGEAAVIGARNGEVTYNRRIGIPWLMNIPGLGWLFSSVEERKDEKDLMVVVQARVLLDADDAAAETLRRQRAFARAISRSADLGEIGSAPYAILLETTRTEESAEVIAHAFNSDGFSTQIRSWNESGRPAWDIYITDLTSFEEAGRLARRLSEAGWSTELTVLSPVNALAGD